MAGDQEHGDRIAWNLCSACHEAPSSKSGKKLLRCRNCQVAQYHDATCQRNDWKQHKRICQLLAKIFGPLAFLLNHMEMLDENERCWWQQVPEEARSHKLWEDGLSLWYRQDYLNAMGLFQASLKPYDRSWKQYLQKGASKMRTVQHVEASVGTDSIRESEAGPCTNSYGNDKPDDNDSFRIAQRLLFCAYCELDGQQNDAGRDHLTQCISILHSVARSSSSKEVPMKQKSSTWDDAWMELVLSLEEETPLTRKYSRNMASLALELTKNWADDNGGDRGIYCCGWKHPLQRPGYMAAIPSEFSPAFIPRERHPEWCRILEKHFDEIWNEYESLCKQSQGWSKVGSGERGSGYDDHRVVAGQDWSEYVLFGTGATSNEAKRTKQLLRQYVPDAVSLAEQGGGEVIFSKLAPHTHIQSHCGPTNLRWTAHLGLVVPEMTSTAPNSNGCQIRVGHKWYGWKRGEILLFDDSYEHEVRNDTDQERVILLMRLWHPQLDRTTRDSLLLEARQRKEEAVEKRYHPPP